MLNLAVILDRELNGIGRHIPGIIGYERFLQCVGFARNQHSLHVVRRIFGHPFVYNIAVLVQNAQRGTGDFFVSRNISFADFYAGRGIQHCNGLAEPIGILQQNPTCRVGDFGIGRLVGNLLIGKECRSRRAGQVDLIKRQIGEIALPQALGNGAVIGGIGEIHHQHAVHAVPVGNDNAVCIGILAQQLIPESTQLGGNRSHGIIGECSGGDNTAGLVLGIFGFMQYPDRRFLQVAVIARGLLQAELNRAGGGIAVCRAGLGQRIDFGGIAVPGKVVGKMQSTNHMSRVAAFPAIHHIAVPIGHGQGGTGQGKGGIRIRGESTLVDLHGGLLVGVQAVNDLPCNKLVFVGELHRNYALLNQVAVRHTDLAQVVAATVCRPVVGIAAAVMFAAQGNIHVKIGKAVLIGGGCA